MRIYCTWIRITRKVFKLCYAHVTTEIRSTKQQNLSQQNSPHRTMMIMKCSNHTHSTAHEQKVHKQLNTEIKSKSKTMQHKSTMKIIAQIHVQTIKPHGKIIGAFKTCRTEKRLSLAWCNKVLYLYLYGKTDKGLLHQDEEDCTTGWLEEATDLIAYLIWQ